MKPTEAVPSFGKKTKYRGIEFKSICEARWAAMFDQLGIDWEYEPNGESTFPDFHIRLTLIDTSHSLFEVKGAIGTESNPFGFSLTKEIEVDEAFPGAVERRGGQFVALTSPDWANHPDAAKARSHAAAIKSYVFVGTNDGGFWVPRVPTDGREPNLLKPEWWIPSKFKNDSGYEWDRTKIMVTGRGKV